MVHSKHLMPIWLAFGLVAAQSSSFDAREATIDSVHHSLFTGLSSCRDIVSSFLSRIQMLNNHTNAIISLNPNVLSIADQLDESLTSGNATGKLFCIPILLKDNYNTADMPTTGGNLALANSQPANDAPSVTAVKREGAIILGKANLHEFALEGLSVSSLGGQTINPYDSTRTPGGSSGGTGAAVAASFSVFGTGTDTVNSLRSPASANSLFSIRPTRGLITRGGIVPISYTQDAIGPIARTIKDVATALTIMASTGFDASDNATALVPSTSRNIDYTVSLTTGSLKGLRLGVLDGFFNRTASPETTPVNLAMDTMLSRLRVAGATIIPITSPLYNATALQALDVQRFEYREAMDTYLSNPSLHGLHPTTLSSVYTPNSSTNPGEFLVIPSQYEFVNTALKSSSSNTTYPTFLAEIQNLTLALSETFTTNNLTALLYPEQKNLAVKLGSPSQSGRNGILAALTGSPVVTVPAGFSNATKDAPVGVPIGMEILGRKWEEEMLLRIGYQIERFGRVRRSPEWASRVVEVGGMLGSVPEVVPMRNIPGAYPVGVL